LDRHWLTLFLNSLVLHVAVRRHPVSGYAICDRFF